MNQKGFLGLWTIVALILVLIGFIIIYTIIRALVFTDLSSPVCSFTLAWHAKVPSVLRDVIPIRCETRDVQLTAKLAEKARLSNDQTLQEGMARVALNEMVRCRNLLGGKSGQTALTGGVKCAICAIITVDKDLPAVDHKLLEKSLFVQTNQEGESYYGRLVPPPSRFSGEEEAHDVFIHEEGLRPGRSYAVLYIDQYTSDLALQIFFGGAATLAAGRVFGLKGALATAAVSTVGIGVELFFSDHNDYNKILLVPEEKIKPPPGGVCQEYVY